MGRRNPSELRLELLRMRATIERAELRVAVLELGSATRPLGRLVDAATSMAQWVASRRGGVASIAGTAIGLLSDRPWLLSTVAALAPRGLRRGVLIGAAAVLAVWSVRRLAARPKSGVDARNHEDAAVAPQSIHVRRT